MKKLLPLAIAVAVVLLWQRVHEARQPALDGAAPAAAVAPGQREAAALEDWRSGKQVSGTGTVVRILADDDDGSRHQRFIIELESGRTLLIAHNIDLAPRIDALAQGDLVEFNGEYEWNDRGGLVHWTHHDPQGEHAAGWLRHNGRIYQ